MQVVNWTQLTIRDAPGRVDRLCFGRPVTTSRRHRPPPPPSENTESSVTSETLLRFTPGQCFGLVRWRRDPAGRQRRVFAVMEALPVLSGTQESEGNCHRLADLEPAVRVHLLLEQLGPAGYDGIVDHMLDLLLELRNHEIDPSGLRPVYLREAADRHLADLPPRWPGSNDYRTGKRPCHA